MQLHLTLMKLLMYYLLFDFVFQVSPPALRRDTIRYMGSNIVYEPPHPMQQAPPGCQGMINPYQQMQQVH